MAPYMGRWGAELWAQCESLSHGCKSKADFIVPMAGGCQGKFWPRTSEDSWSGSALMGSVTLDRPLHLSEPQPAGLRSDNGLTSQGCCADEPKVGMGLGTEMLNKCRLPCSSIHSFILSKEDTFIICFGSNSTQAPSLGLSAAWAGAHLPLLYSLQEWRR